MAQALPPGISALAHQHRLGTPLKCYTQSGIILLLSILIVILVLTDVLYLLVVLAHPASFQLGSGLLWQAWELVLVVFALYTIWDQRSSYFYLCSAGFLELKRGKALTVKHALRWDDVRGVRRSRGRYYVTDKQDWEFRINCRDIWKRCREQPKVKKSRKRA
jgi:hypothetical protein